MFTISVIDGLTVRLDRGEWFVDDHGDWKSIHEIDYYVLDGILKSSKKHRAYAKFTQAASKEMRHRNAEKLKEVFVPLFVSKCNN